jgi:hypothetical protein
VPVLEEQHRSPQKKHRNIECIAAFMRASHTNKTSFIEELSMRRAANRL